MLGRCLLSIVFLGSTMSTTEGVSQTTLITGEFFGRFTRFPTRISALLGQNSDPPETGDKRTMETILSDFITPPILDDDYSFSPSGKSEVFLKKSRKFFLKIDVFAIALVSLCCPSFGVFLSEEVFF